MDLTVTVKGPMSKRWVDMPTKPEGQQLYDTDGVRIPDGICYSAGMGQ